MLILEGKSVEFSGSRMSLWRLLAQVEGSRARRAVRGGAVPPAGLGAEAAQGGPVYVQVVVTQNHYVKTQALILVAQSYSEVWLFVLIFLTHRKGKCLPRLSL